MLKLMNSAMMPQEGVYIAKKISVDDAREIFRRHCAVFESYIGYPETAQFLSEIFGVSVPVSRAETKLEDGDEIIVCKLKYRLSDPNQKGRIAPTRDDFEFWYVQYKSGS